MTASGIYLYRKAIGIEKGTGDAAGDIITPSQKQVLEILSQIK